jgi:hypothetical protein
MLEIVSRTVVSPWLHQLTPTVIGLRAKRNLTPPLFAFLQDESLRSTVVDNLRRVKIAL